MYMPIDYALATMRIKPVVANKKEPREESGHRALPTRANQMKFGASSKSPLFSRPGRTDFCWPNRFAKANRDQ